MSEHFTVEWLGTLRYGEEVRQPDAYFEDMKKSKPEAKLIGLAETFIAENTRAWTPEMAQDPVQDRLLEIIAAAHLPMFDEIPYRHVD